MTGSKHETDIRRWSRGLARLALAALLGALPLVASCSGGDDDGSGPPGPFDTDPPDNPPTTGWPQTLTPEHTLLPLGSCDEMETYVKEAAFQAVAARLMVNWQFAEDWFGDSDSDSDSDSDGDSDMDSDSDMDADTDADSDSDADGDGDFTETNVQEQGVDEADLVKTDGDYFYVLSGSDLVIVEVQDAGLMAESGRLEVGGAALELMIYGDLAVAFSSLAAAAVPEELQLAPAPSSANPDDWDDQPEPGYSQLTLIDISDKANPQLVRTIQFAGNYVTSRRVDNALRVVLTTPVPAFHLPLWTWDWQNSSTTIEEAFAELLEQNAAAIDATDFDDVMPRLIDIPAGLEDPEAEPLVRCTDSFGPASHSGFAFATTVSIDLSSPLTQQRNVAVFADLGVVYASQESLYITTSRGWVMTAITAELWDTDSSGIHKFDIATNPGMILYEASGEAEGHMLNQFCLGEHDGFLRVATTSGTTWADLDNHLLIFEQVDQTLELVSEIHGLGAGEQFFAARFMGDRGFILTAVPVSVPDDDPWEDDEEEWEDDEWDDPLFTFDLTDPYNPQTMGEWDGPGYSTYMHPMGENHLITVGIDAGFGHISLYDLTDFAMPTLVERVEFPTMDHQSTALDDHKAFTYSPSRELVALPFYEWDMNTTGLMLYDVVETGIDPAGTLLLGGDEVLISPAQRGIFIGDLAYGLSRCRITSSTIADPGTILSTIELYEGSTCPDDPLLD